MSHIDDATITPKTMLLISNSILVNAQGIVDVLSDDVFVTVGIFYLNDWIEHTLCSFFLFYQLTTIIFYSSGFVTFSNFKRLLVSPNERIRARPSINAVLFCGVTIFTVFTNTCALRIASRPSSVSHSPRAS